MDLESELANLGISQDANDSEEPNKAITLLEQIEENTRKRRRNNTSSPTDPYDNEIDLECPYEVDSENEYCSSWCHYCEQYGAKYNKPSSWNSMSFFNEPFTKLLTLPLALMFAPFGTLRGGDYSLMNSNIIIDTPLVAEKVEEIATEAPVEKTKSLSWFDEMNQARLEILELDRQIEEIENKNATPHIEEVEEKSELQRKFEQMRRIA